MTVTKPRASGTMTEAKFHGRLVAALRKETTIWKPKRDAMSRCRVAVRQFKCECCSAIVPSHVPGEWQSGKKKGKPRSVPNFFADHIVPIVGPEGFTSWDDWIRRAFVEVDGYQGLCKKCHDEKTAAERLARKAAK